MTKMQVYHVVMKANFLHRNICNRVGRRTLATSSSVPEAPLILELIPKSSFDWGRPRSTSVVQNAFPRKFQSSEKLN